MITAMLVFVAIVGHGLLVVAPAANASQNQNADVAWTKTSQTSGASGPDGTIYRKKCSGVNDSDTITRVSPIDGTTQSAVNDPTSTTLCSEEVIVGKEGRTFSIEQGQISGFDALGQRIWVSDTGTCTSWEGEENLVRPGNVKLAADGNLYALSGNTWSCEGTTPTQLIRIDAASGDQVSLVNLNGLIDNGADLLKSLFAYKSGLVLFEYSYTSESKVRFFDLWGNEAIHKMIALDSQKIDPNQAITVSYEGTITYLSRGGTRPECGFSNPASISLIYVSQNGIGTSIREICEKDEWRFELKFGPNETIHLQTVRFSDGHSLYSVMQKNGQIVYQQDLSTRTDSSTITSGTYPRVNIDANGDTLRTYDITDSGKRYFILELTDHAGDILALFDARNQPEAASNGLRFTGEPALTGGYVYVAPCQGACSTLVTPTLYKISMGNLNIDYGRAPMLVPAFDGKLRYVAMGDSFSSGEGNAPFYDWTNIDGVNQCHRSPNAYPMLLTNDSSLNLDLLNFTACSGAETTNLINGQWNEPPQVQALNRYTDMVTLTIGGNDAGFVPFMRACLTPNDTCQEGSSAYTNIDNYISNVLPGELVTLYGEISSRIGPNTRVLVVGYPLIASETGGLSSHCTLLNQDERVAIGEMARLLNLKGIGSVASFGDSRFSFVSAMDTGSPFENHDMCAVDNYITEPVVGNPEGFIAHPNIDGHAAYATLVKDYLTVNP